MSPGHPAFTMAGLQRVLVDGWSAVAAEIQSVLWCARGPAKRASIYHFAALYQFRRDIPGETDVKVVVSDRRMQKLVTTDRRMRRLLVRSARLTGLVRLWSSECPMRSASGPSASTRAHPEGRPRLRRGSWAGGESAAAVRDEGRRPPRRSRADALGSGTAWQPVRRWAGTTIWGLTWQRR